jgi:hypothetical protein
LHVEQAASDNTISKQISFFMARSSEDRRLMVSDIHLTFQIENAASPQLYAAQRIPRNWVSAGSLP